MSSYCNCNNYLEWCFKLCEEDHKKCPSGNCCCKDAVRDALKKIQLMSTTSIIVHHFNQSIGGEGAKIDGFVGNDVVIIDGEYVSLCNIIYIDFKLTAGELPSMDCTTNPDCCCNIDMEKALRTLISTSTPENPLEILIIQNQNDYSKADAIYGICNGVLWIHSQTGNVFQAIPLCSILSARLAKQ